MLESAASIFSLHVDATAKDHLSETAKWARFLAIAGFVFLALMLIGGIYSTIILSRFQNVYTQSGTYPQGSFATGVGVSYAVLYVGISVIGFFPLLFMLRFANAMKMAIVAEDQVLLNKSFQNLKKYFRYVGIITVMSLVLMGVILLVGIMGTIF